MNPELEADGTDFRGQSGSSASVGGRSHHLIFLGIWAQSSCLVPLERMTMGRPHAGAGGGFGRSSAISRKISWNNCRGMATSAIWKAMLRPWLTTFAPILISFSFRLVSDQSLIG